MCVVKGYNTQEKIGYLIEKNKTEDAKKGQEINIEAGKSKTKFFPGPSLDEGISL